MVEKYTPNVSSFSVFNPIKTQRKQFFIKLLCLFFLMVNSILYAQTTIINSSGTGGFNVPGSLGANGWTSVSNATDQWVFGDATNTGNNNAYISTDNGVTWSYGAADAVSHLYYEFTVPANEGKLTLDFKWKAGGEGAVTNDFDNMRVFLVPSYYTPQPNVSLLNTGATRLFGAGAVGEMYKLNSATYNDETIVFAGTPGVTYRLVFSWKTNGTVTANPPASIDDVNLSSDTPINFVSTTTGNYSDLSIWDNFMVPTAGDNVTISTGHTVSVDKLGQFANNLVVDGTLNFGGLVGSQPGDFGVRNNLVINSNGLVNLFNGSVGKNLVVGGNITNNGRLDTSVGSGLAGKLVLQGFFPQTVSGTGAIGGTVASTNNTNTVDVINILEFKNLNTSIPNIIWEFNNIKIRNLLLIDGARINMGTRKMTLGNFAAPSTGSLAPLNRNSGFLPGAKISRWISVSGLAAPFAIGVDPASTLNRYPFVDFSGNDRALYLNRNNNAAVSPTNTAGELAVTYTDGSGFTTGLTLTDGAYTVNDRFNGKWTLSTEGTAYATAATTTHGLATFATNGIITSAQTTRLMLLNSFVGTHQNGSTTPCAQRIGLTTANLLAGDFYMGIANTNTSIVSASSGDWNTAATWVGGIVPSCTDAVVISANHNVNVATNANAKNITISNTGILKVDAGVLTVGCALNNNFLNNNGELIVTAGTLKINGHLESSLNSKLSQSGGNIIVDGNDAGIIANSVPNGTALVRFATPVLTLNGGQLTIVDPHASTTANDAFVFNVAGTNHVNITSGHTINFGDGVSNENGGNSTAGFRINTAANSSKLSFNNFTVNAGNVGNNRFVTSATPFGVNGDFLVDNNSEFRDGSGIIYVAKNITNNGRFISTGTLYLGTFLDGVAGTTGAAQAIAGTGSYLNSIVGSSANFSSLTFNNSSATGVTLSLPISVRDNLNMLSGRILTSNTNILSLGTLTTAGIINYPTSTLPAYVVGPFQRTLNINSSGSFVNFPMGISSYSPIAIAPATTGPTVFKVETFDINSGTADTTILNLTNDKRWLVTLVSGTFTDMNVQIGNSSIAAGDIVVQAPTASGIYTNALGNSATFLPATTTLPNQVYSSSPVTFANFTGHFSYARYNGCSGTPSPGNTNATSTAICIGDSVSLSTQNAIPGLGVTYQWQSSSNNISFNNISGETNSTLSIIPTSDTYYRCEVLCSGNFGYSTSTFIVLSNKLEVANPTVVCAPNAVNITLPALTAGSSTGLTYAYYSDAAATNVLSNPTAVTIAGTYYIKATNTVTGCSNIKPILVSINSQPNVVVSNPTSVCAPNTVSISNSSVTAGSTTGLTFGYFTDAAATAVLSNPSAVVTSGTYYIKGTNTSGCSEIEAVTVTINPLPTVVVNNPAPACNPSTVNLTSAGVTTGSTLGLTYSYFTDAAATVPVTNPNAVNTSGTYYIKGINASGCEDIEAVTVTINSIGTPVGTSPQTIFNTAAAVIEQISVASVGTLTWYATNADALAGTNPLPAGFVISDSATYYCTQTIGGCPSAIPLAIKVGVVLGVEDFDLNELNFYPNPITNVFNIKYNQIITDVLVYDLSGRSVMSLKPNDTQLQLNFENFANSMYFVKLKTEDEETVLKVYKK
jgi:hypothetical protein